MRAFTVNNAMVSQLKSKLVSQGFNISEFDTHSVQDQPSFFKAALGGLPMGDATKHPDVSWVFPQNWAAFTDFLWQGVSEQASPLAILWTGSVELQNVNPKLYQDAIEAVTTADEGGNVDFPAFLFLIGSGPSFAKSIPDFGNESDTQQSFE